MYMHLYVCVCVTSGWVGWIRAGWALASVGHLSPLDTSAPPWDAGACLLGVALDTSCISICFPLIWFSDTPTLLTGCLLGFKHSRLALQTGSSAQQVGVCQVKSWTLTE